MDNNELKVLSQLVNFTQDAIETLMDTGYICTGDGDYEHVTNMLKQAKVILAKYQTNTPIEQPVTEQQTTTDTEQPCVQCGSTSNVEHTTDPYDNDVHNDYSKHWLCKQCQAYSAMEV